MHSRNLYFHFGSIHQHILWQTIVINSPLISERTCAVPSSSILWIPKRCLSFGNDCLCIDDHCRHHFSGLLIAAPSITLIAQRNDPAARTGCVFRKPSSRSLGSSLIIRIIILSSITLINSLYPTNYQIAQLLIQQYLAGKSCLAAKKGWWTTISNCYNSAFKTRKYSLPWSLQLVVKVFLRVPFMRGAWFLCQGNLNGIYSRATGYGAYQWGTSSKQVWMKWWHVSDSDRRTSDSNEGSLQSPKE